MASSSAVSGIATIQGLSQQPQRQQQERMYLNLGSGFGSALQVATAALPGIPARHYSVLSLVVLESWLLHKDLTCLNQSLVVITALVQRVGETAPELVMRCAAVVLRAVLLLLAPVLHGLYKDSQKGQQGATVAADGAAAAAVAAWIAADPNRRRVVEMAQATAAELDMQDSIEERLQEAFDPDPLPSRAWKYFSKFVCNLLVLSEYICNKVPVIRCLADGSICHDIQV